METSRQATGAATGDADAAAVDPRASFLARAPWADVGPLVLAAGALGWALAAMWPRGGLPAWPAVTLGLIALGLSWGRGPALRRALTSIVGTLAALLGGAQIAVLWAAAAALSHSYM